VGRALLAVLLASRTVTWTVGCNNPPPPGSQGGKCEDNGCNTYCNDGLTCDNSTNTCVGAPAASTTPPAPGCDEWETDACGSQVPYRCVGGALPDRACVLQSTEPGSALYCCTPRCHPDPNANWLGCASPATDYWCDDPLVPDAGDASYLCLQYPPSYKSHYYCCAPPDTCFAVPEESLLSACASPADQLFCTGPAPTLPAGKSCTQVAYDGGAGVGAYCCVDSSSDAAAGEDAADGGAGEDAGGG
jgi:hypothetical protein